MKLTFPVGLILGLVAGGAIGTIGGFGAAKKLASGQASSMIGAGENPNSAPMFSLDGKTFTLGDLPAELRNTLLEAQAASYERAEGSVKEFALRVALAKEKDPAVTIDKLPALQELMTGTTPNEEEVKKFYEENKGRLPPNVTFEQIKGQLGQFMVRQKAMEGMQAELGKLTEAGRLKILMPQPVAPKVDLDLAGYPARGPEGAKAVLVEASDYLCPHCREVQPEVDTLIKEMGDKFRFVQITYSLRPDGLSGALARGAFCANKQGAEIFWKYHEAAFKVSPEEAANTDRANDKVVVGNVAKEAGAKADEFASCLDSADAAASVQATLSKLSQAGVTGTPTFFLNNRKVAGHGQPLKDLVNNALKGG